MGNMKPRDAISGEQPWVHFITSDENYRDVLSEASMKGSLVKILDARSMIELDELFQAYASAYDFPDYFGKNWPAFDECLLDLSNMPSGSYLTVITNADSLLLGDRRDLPIYLQTMERIGRAWSTRVGLGPEWGTDGVAFNTVLHCSSRFEDLCRGFGTRSD